MVQGSASLTEPLRYWATSQSTQPYPRMRGSAWADLYFPSCSWDQNMDSLNIQKNSEQRTATAVDQFNSKNPEEENKVSTGLDNNPGANLAAGVEKMRLQNKKLSGAQKKKLLKEKKIKEGTWTVQKPLLNQNKAGGGSSGEGKKRPHSDSSTPTAIKQDVKKPRRNDGSETYSDAAVGIRMAVVNSDHPDSTLNQEQAELVQRKLLEVVDKTPPGGVPPQFLRSHFAQGILWMNCANEESKRWLVQTVGALGELWAGAQLIAVDAKDLPKRHGAMVWIPDNADCDKVLARLGIQNPSIKTSQWKIMSRKVVEKGQTLAISMDSASYGNLEGQNFRAFWGLGRIIFKPLKNNKEVQGHPDKPTSQ